MKRIGLKLFVAAIAVALAVYGFTQPAGLPWGVGGRIPQAWIAAAVAAGFVAALANRHFGWRVGIAAALAWIFLPRIWNAAVLGGRIAVYGAAAIFALWVLDSVLLVAFSGARKTRDAAKLEGLGEMSNAGHQRSRGFWNRIAGICILAAAIAFAIVSIVRHDYRLGSAATVFAKGVVESAGDRIIVLSGICDEQVRREVVSSKEKGVRKDSSSTSTLDFDYIVPTSTDPDYRRSIVEWARKEWPAETNLAVAAQVGVATFLDLAIKAHPERFFVMTGGSASIENWEKRWNAFAPYRDSQDRFARIGCLAFAYEANGIANELRDEKVEKVGGGGEEKAWKLYWKILKEVDEHNIAAVINLNEMSRKGYLATDEESRRIRDELAEFFGDRTKMKHAREFVRSAGPVKSDPELIEKLAEEHRKKVEAAMASGEKLQLTPAAKQLVQINNEMVKAAEEGDLAKAARLARKILADPKHHGFIPANAVMGAAAAKDGDYIAAEAFYRTATSGTNATPVAVWNDYADTLMHLGKLDEAEKMIRKVIAETDEKMFVPRYTLAEILSKKVEKLGGGGDVDSIREEVLALIASVVKNAPPEAAARIRVAQKRGELLK